MKKLRNLYYFAILLIKYMYKIMNDVHILHKLYALNLFFEVLVYIFSPPFNSEVKIK